MKHKGLTIELGSALISGGRGLWGRPHRCEKVSVPKRNNFGGLRFEAFIPSVTHQSFQFR
eukprot:2809137-Ditylum_brightwellii.AAC.1